MAKAHKYQCAISRFLKKKYGAQGVVPFSFKLLAEVLIKHDLLEGLPINIRRKIDLDAMEAIANHLGIKRDFSNTPKKSPVPKAPKEPSTSNKKKVKGTTPVDVKTDAFLQSFEWKILRYKALVTYGNKCLCCGRSPSDGIILNVDHIKPRKFFPELSLELTNLQVLCGECNRGKANWDSTDWRK